MDGSLLSGLNRLDNFRKYEFTLESRQFEYGISIQKDAKTKRKDAKKDVTKCSLSHDITRKAADWYTCIRS